MALNNTKAIKLGNWLEELVLEEQTGVKYYPNPKDKKTSLMTKSRCITHSDAVEAKDYASNTQLTILPPQKHAEYQLQTSSKKGPKQLLMEARMTAQVESDFKRTAAEDTAEKNRVLYVSTNMDAYNKKDFKTSLIERDPSIRMQTMNADYASDTAITYYSTKIASKDSKLNFPVTFTGSARNPFQRSSAFSADIKDPIARTSETNEKVVRPPTCRDVQFLRDFRDRLLGSVKVEDPSPGSIVRSLLSFTMSVADANASDYVPVEVLEDFLLQRFGFRMSREEKLAISAAYLADIPGRISLPGFANLIRGRMNPRRIELVNIAFFSLDKQSSGTGKITEDAVASSFFPSPSSGAVANLIDGLGFQFTENGMITFDEFIDYYASVSAEIADNDAFERLIRQSWGL